MTEVAIIKEAAGRAMTLAELRELVADCDRLEAPGSMIVEARGGWSGSRRLTVKRAKVSRSRDVADIDPRPDAPMSRIVPPGTKLTDRRHRAQPDAAMLREAGFRKVDGGWEYP